MLVFGNSGPLNNYKPSTICGYRDKACKVKLEKEGKKVSQALPASPTPSNEKKAGNWFRRLGRAFSELVMRSPTKNNPGNSFVAASPTLTTPATTITNKNSAASVVTPPTFTSLTDAKLDPRYRIGGAGEDLFSGNYNFSLPIVNLPGRAGLDLNLTLSYNSLIWAKFGGTMYFDYDYYPTLPTGFRLGFPEIDGPHFVHNANTYIVYLPSGRRVEMRQVTVNRYEAIDSSYLFLNVNASDPTQMTLFTTDGTQYKYELPSGSYPSRCTQVRDRNGNFISILYKNIGDPEYPLSVIDKVIDTLGREIVFNYDSALHLISITQNWSGQTFTWAQFDYGTITVAPNFGSLNVDGPNGVNIPVITRVITGDGARTTFAYNSWGQAHTITTHGEIDNLRSQGSYAFPGTGISQSDCPRFTQRNDVVFAWEPAYNPATGLGYTITYFYFEQDESFGQVTGPDGVSHREYFSTTGGTRGLTTRTETRDSGSIQQFTNLTWISDSTSSPPLRPRVTDINLCDDRNHNGTYDAGSDKLRRTTIDYDTYATTNVRLPGVVREYNEGGQTVYRTTITSYVASGLYTGITRRLIGLPSQTRLYSGDSGTLIAQTEFIYDSTNDGDTTFLQAHSSTPSQHDSVNYGASFLYRGNLTRTRQYSVQAGTAGAY